MPGNPHTTVRSRRVAAELRQLREAAGLSCQDVAARLGVPTRRIVRLETGAGGLRITDVEALLDVYGVSAERSAELLTVVRQSHQRTWWAQQAGMPGHWRSLAYLEAAATRVRDFQLYLLPTLLRTTDYNRRVLGGGFVRRSAEDVRSLIEVQQARQAELARPGGPSLHAIVDEHALARLRRDDPISREQLRYLLDASERPNVTFQVIPNSVGLHAGMHGGFTLMEYAKDTDVVFTEQLVSATYYQTESDIIVYRDIVTSLLDDALSARQTRDFLNAMLAGTRPEM
jgi:transcriptional regulator with XRE-family HTH domain